MTQERLMKRRMTRAIVLFAITLVALIIFIALYIDQSNRVQETYRKEYNSYLEKASYAIDSYLNAEGDLPLRYRRLLSEVSSADAFAFVMTGLTDEQKIAINGIHACLLKFPEQMQEKKRLEDMRTAFIDMSQNLDKGYDEAAAIVDAVDKKGH